MRFFKNLRTRRFNTTLAFRKGPRCAIQCVSEIPDRLKEPHFVRNGGTDAVVGRTSLPVRMHGNYSYQFVRR
jgi:hypothetical protein